MSKQYYGQHQPPLDYLIEKHYLKDVFEGIGIECGAFDGITESNLKYFEENNNWKIYNIEASPPVYEKLTINRPLSFNFNIGLSNIDSTKIFNHVYHPVLHDNFGNGSFTHYPSHIDSLLNERCIIKEYEIRTLTYNSFVNQNNIKKVDFFVLDVEGHELDVIDGMKDNLILPDIFMIEHSFIGLDNLTEKINSVLPNKFKFDCILHNNAIYKRI